MKVILKGLNSVIRNVSGMSAADGVILWDDIPRTVRASYMIVWIELKRVRLLRLRKDKKDGIVMEYRLYMI